MSGHLFRKKRRINRSLIQHTRGRAANRRVFHLVSQIWAEGSGLAAELSARRQLIDVIHWWERTRELFHLVFRDHGTRRQRIIVHLDQRPVPLCRLPGRRRTKGFPRCLAPPNKCGRVERADHQAPAPSHRVSHRGTPNRATLKREIKRSFRLQTGEDRNTDGSIAKSDSSRVPSVAIPSELASPYRTDQSRRARPLLAGHPG